MTWAILAGLLALAGVVWVSMREDARSQRSKRALRATAASLDTLEQLAAADPVAREQARRKILLRGAGALAPMTERLRQLDDDGLSPAHQLAIEDTIADLGNVGVAKLLRSLGGLPRGHAATPALARVAETLGPRLVEVGALREVSIELEALLLDRLVRRHGVDVLAGATSNAAALVLAGRCADPPSPAAQLLRATLPSPDAVAARRAWKAGAGRAQPEFTVDLVTEPDGVSVALAAGDVAAIDLVASLEPTARAHPRCVELGWVDTDEPADPARWLRWATVRASQPRVTEALHAVAARGGEGAWWAAAAIALAHRDSALELLRLGRRRPWPPGDTEWVRVVARQAGPGGAGALLDAVCARAPVRADELGGVFADQDHDALVIDLATRYPAMEGWLAVWTTMAILARSPERAPIRSLIGSSDRRARRGAIEIAGRLGLAECAGAIVEQLSTRELDEGVCVVSLELLGVDAAAALRGHRGSTPAIDYLSGLFSLLEDRERPQER